MRLAVTAPRAMDASGAVHAALKAEILEGRLDGDVPLWQYDLAQRIEAVIRLRMTQVTEVDWPQRAHAAILDACAAGDTGRGVARLLSDIETTGRACAAYLRRKPPILSGVQDRGT